MKTRRLGDSDLEVTEISLGSWLTYSGGVERDQTEACTRAAFDAGINFFDTANAYGDGASEAAWGEILSDYPRDSYVLATKVYFEGSAGGGLSAEQIAKQIDLSLERLQTDYVDLYQCHRFDTGVAIEETMEALTEVVESGKARYIGFSEWTPEQIEAGLAVGGAKFISSQPQYSMLWRAPEEEVFPLCSDNGISQIVWSPLAEGVLTGKYEPGSPPPEDSRAASEEMGSFIKERLDDEALEAVQRLRPIAEEAGLSMPAARPRLGPTTRGARERDHRGEPARAGPPERRGVGGRALRWRAERDRRGARRRPAARDDAGGRGSGRRHSPLRSA